MGSSTYLAIDLGAESGRAISGRLQGNRLSLEEIHRFGNGPVRIADHLHWDVLRLYAEILTALKLAAGTSVDGIASMGLDTWGVDFGLLDARDNLIGNPYHYRDARTDGVVEAALRMISRQEIYRQTGIQFMQLNTLFQLLAYRLEADPALEMAATYLSMPDLLNFWLTGRKANEFTISTTTQCYNPLEKCWAKPLLDALGLPDHIFQTITQPGTILSELRTGVAQEAGCLRIPVVAVGSHDTASAVAAIPAQGSDHIYISSGTWSLMGIETDEPIINEQSLAYNLTNEGGIDGKIRFLKNIMGMWLLQECRREWAAQGQIYSYDDLSLLASQSPALQSLVCLGDETFLAPGEMVERIRDFCRTTGQSVPETVGATVRCILESLAMEYRWVAEKLQELYGKPLPVIHIIGGGSRNRLLNQFTADATGCKVVAGPIEATAIGNIIVQAMALGQIDSLAEGRALVRNSFDVAEFYPGSSQPWDDCYTRYCTMKINQLV